MQEIPTNPSEFPMATAVARRFHSLRRTHEGHPSRFGDTENGANELHRRRACSHALCVAGLITRIGTCC